MPVTKTPIQKRPSFWLLIGSAASFASIYFIQGVIDSVLLLQIIQYFLAAAGIGAAGKLGYDKFMEKFSK